MKTFNLFLLFILLCNVAFSQEKKKNASFDFSSIEPFWHIVSVLQQDKEPSDQEWSALFSTPGYKTLIERELPEKWLKRYMTMGIMPSNKEEIQKWIEKKYSDVRFVLHFQEVSSRKEEIILFIDEFRNKNDVKKTISMVEKFLPKGVSTNSIPTVSFIFFDKDARGYQPILMDVLLAMDLCKDNLWNEVLAHEFHHFYRESHISFNFPTDESNDSRIIWFFNQIHLEGVADMINKEKEFERTPSSEMVIRYKKYLNEVPSDISKMDSLLSLYNKEPEKQKEINEEIEKSVKQSGHPMGFYMASSIQKYCSRKYVVKEIGNPFGFFYRYNEAAKKSKDKLPVFSDAAIATINQLEAKYSKK